MILKPKMSGTSSGGREEKVSAGWLWKRRPTSEDASAFRAPGLTGKPNGQQVASSSYWLWITASAIKRTMLRSATQAPSSAQVLFTRRWRGIKQREKPKDGQKARRKRNKTGSWGDSGKQYAFSAALRCQLVWFWKTSYLCMMCVTMTVPCDAERWQDPQPNTREWVSTAVCIWRHTLFT